MYAVVNSGGKLAKVTQDAVVAVELLDAEVGSVVTLPAVFVTDGERVLATPAELEGVTVTAEVLEHFQGQKQSVFKFKRRKGYKRTKGHRQWYTAVRVTDIAVGAAPAQRTSRKAAAAAGAPAAAESPAEGPVLAETPAPSEAAAPAEAAQSVETGQCEAVKADGTRCANKAKEGSRYCGVHAKKYEA